MTSYSVRLIALVAVLGTAATVRAEKVAYTFTGTVTSVTPGGLLPFEVQAGDSFTGSFSYDDSTTSNTPGFHPLQMGGLDVLVNGVHRFQIPDANGFLAIGDNALTGETPRDHFFAQMNATTFPPITEHGHVTYSGIVSLVAENDLGALTGNKLAGLKLDLSKFDERVLEFAGGDTAGSGFWQIRGEFTSLQQQQAPEPGSLALLALGGAGLAGYRWRRRG